MFKVIKAVMNSMNRKTYLMNKSNLVLYKTDMKAPVPKDESCEEYKKIHSLADTIKCHNLKVYLTVKRNIFLQKLALYIAPVVLTGAVTMTIKNFYYASSQEFDVYRKHTIEFDEENILKDDISENLYIYPSEQIIMDDSYIKTSLEDKATLYAGEGTDAMQYHYSIDEEGRWSWTGLSQDVFFPLEDSAAIAEISENYEEILKGAFELFNSSAEYIEEKEFLKNKLDNGIVDIRMVLEQYEFYEKQNVPVKNDHFWRLVLLIIALLINLAAIILCYDDAISEKSEQNEEAKENEELKEKSNLENDTMVQTKKAIFLLHKVRVLLHRGEELFQLTDEEIEEEGSINILYASMQAKAEYLAAEEARILKLFDILEKNQAGYNILTTYEKRVVENALDIKILTKKKGKEKKGI